MVGLQCVVSQCAELHVAGWTWAVFTRVYLESCTWPWRFSRWIRERSSECASDFESILGKVRRRPSQWFNKPSGTKSWVVRVCFIGMPGSRPVSHQLTMINTTGRPTSCTTPGNVSRIQQLVRQNRHRTIHDIAEGVEIGYGTCLRGLTKELVRTDLAALPWQRPVSHLLSHPAASGEIQNDCHPTHTALPRFGTLRLPISKNESEAERTPVRYHWGDPGRIAESAWH
jgi:hypothetical protein